MPAHLRQDGSANAQQAEYVSAIQPLHFLVGGFLDRAQQSKTGVIQEDVDSTEAFDCRSRRFVSLRPVRYVERQSQQVRMTAEGVNDCLWIAGCRHDVLADFQNPLCYERPKSPRCASDKPGFHTSSPFLFLVAPNRSAFNDSERILRKAQRPPFVDCCDYRKIAMT